MGTGDRSDRIRTYNYPQGRVTDHRINLTLYKLDEVVEGDLDAVIQPLRQEHQADLLAALAQSEDRGEVCGESHGEDYSNFRSDASMKSNPSGASQ